MHNSTKTIVMETGFLNFHDGEHFSTLSSPLYGQDILDDSEGSLLYMMQDDFRYEPPGTDLWDTEQELNGDMAVLPVSGPLEGVLAAAQHSSKEDFQKMLSEWQEHLGSLQASDTEDMDVKDIVGLDMVMSKQLPEQLPDNIFDEPPTPLPIHQAKIQPFSLSEHLGDELSDINVVDGFDLLGPTQCDISSNKKVSCDTQLESFLEVNVEDDDDLELKVVEEDVDVLGLEEEEVAGGDGANCLLRPDGGTFTIIEPSVVAKLISQSPVAQVQNNGPNKLTKSKAGKQSKARKLVPEVKDKSRIAKIKEKGVARKSKESSHAVKMKEFSPVAVTKDETPTVKQQMAVLEAGDVTSLLQQFEKASESSVVPTPSPSPAPTTPKVTLSHQNIRDSLPKEVIDRIKASGRKKLVPLIPAMPSKRSGRAATRMQDAGAALSRNKLLKIVSGGETVQLDHDYCSVSATPDAPPRSFYHADASDYSGRGRRTTEYVPASHKDEWEKNARKDSGLESGDVSDASEETVSAETSLSLLKSHSGSTVVTVNGREVLIETAKNKDQPAMVSVLKKCVIPAMSAANTPVGSGDETSKESTSLAPKKRKLNLEEYRSRVRELERTQGSRTTTPSSSPLRAPLTCTVGTCMTEDRTNEGRLLAIKAPPGPRDPAPPTDCPSADRSASLPSRTSVGVQTSEDSDYRAGLHRDRRRRQYRSRRASSSSSQSSSGSSRDSHRRRNSVRRRKPSRRHRSPHHSSIGSSSRSFWSPSPSRSQSRSRSNSSGRSSSCSSRSGLKNRRSPSRWYSRQRRCGRDYRDSMPGRVSLNHGRHRSRSPIRRPPLGDWHVNVEEKQRQVEERRVIYVGRIEEGTTKAELRRRFEVFGTIVDISVHFREHGDNYGFVTFAHKMDAYVAVEHGNDDQSQPRYDLCFGGRRAFCKTRYADLDGMATKGDALSSSNLRGIPRGRPHVEDSFDHLLRDFQAQLRKRKV